MTCRLVELSMGHTEKITLCLRTDFDLSDSKHKLSPEIRVPRFSMIWQSESRTDQCCIWAVIALFVKKCE